jgi:hypothetical protein
VYPMPKNTIFNDGDTLEPARGVAQLIVRFITITQDGLGPLVMQTSSPIPCPESGIRGGRVTSNVNCPEAIEAAVVAVATHWEEKSTPLVR